LAVLLDTDHFSILQLDQHPVASVLHARLAHLAVSEVATSIISFQEQAQGWLAYIRRARKAGEVLKGFSYLHDLLNHYSSRPVLPFDLLAMNEFVALQRQRIRIGTSDIRIAAIARANGLKLLSRNLRDFRQVPNLDVEDWTQ
jgi:tRNA(fMet)-specific endonuclease VapC